MHDINVPVNQTPLTAKYLGIYAAVFKRSYRMGVLIDRGTITPFKLMIHSPYALPTKKDRQFQMVNMDYDTFWVTPQINTIDDSMIAMKPHE